MAENKKTEWQEFEKFVADIFKELDPTCLVNYDELLLNRQIDVTIRRSLMGTDFLIIVQVKYYKKSVPVTDVDSFESVIREVQANKGIIVSNKGFTKGARDKAKKTKIELYSVIDSSNPKFKRPFLMVPVIKTSVNVLLKIVYQFTVLKEGKSVTLGPPDLGELSNDFMNMWIRNEVDRQNGAHILPLTKLPPGTIDMQINGGYFEYEVKRRYHFKKMMPSEYRGFQSLITNKFTPSFMKFENFSLLNDETWEYIPDVSAIPLNVSYVETEVISSNVLPEKFIHARWVGN